MRLFPTPPRPPPTAMKRARAPFATSSEESRLGVDGGPLIGGLQRSARGGPMQSAGMLPPMRVVVLGAGYMGSAMAVVAKRRGHDVRLWGTWLDDALLDPCERGE